MTKVSRLSLALLLLFVLSGFSGLIYQSVWSHYLGLTLGHAAYAQTLVLAIYMGGMALGAWLASRYSPRWRQLILGYALVEGVIGLLGVAFHALFVAYTDFSQQTVLPGLPGPGFAHAYQWLSAALMIAPQSILLGATFPLMSAGLMRAVPNQDGEVLGGLYFTNSLGAALGALVATFVLLPAVGLPGTVLTAGLLNVAVGIGAWGLSKLLGERNRPAPEAAQAERRSDVDASAVRRLGRIMMIATAVSGAASFVYEVGWVRLLNQALGTTVHSFELMLAAFILGLAFGGLWIRKRARNLTEPVRYVGYVQVLMGIAALLSIPVFTQSFTWVGWMMNAFARNESGYTLFELGTAAIALLVMFPAAFFAGMTLPLFTLALLRAGAGERAIGRIYAANTLGAIVGVALAMHVLIPLLGVRLAVTLAALADAVIGLYLLRAINPARLSPGVGAAALATVAAMAFSLVLGKPDPLNQISGVFRSGDARMEQGKVAYLKDGKTATVSVFSNGSINIIATNGKPDASLTGMDQAPTPDEATMIMAATLPLRLHPAPERIAVIGWGSGLTTHSLLGSPLPKQVDTIEIERAMHDGARLFGKRVERGYTDSRSHLQIDDARTFFSTGARRYDVIVSEPSNPWVSGVASLFTQEFYSFLKQHLEEDGMLVQWLHVYELDDALVGTMMAALIAEFPDAQLYVSNSADVLIVARKHAGKWANRPAREFAGADLRGELTRMDLVSDGSYALRRVGSANVLRAYVRMLGAKPHSDFYPTVSLNAPRTRFMKKQSRLLMDLVINGLPVLDVLDCRKPVGRAAGLKETKISVFSEWQHIAMDAADGVKEGGVSGEFFESHPEAAVAVQSLLATSEQLAEGKPLLKEWSDGAAILAVLTIGHLPPEDLSEVWATPGWLPAAAQESPEVAAIMRAYRAAAMRDASGMRTSAEAVLRIPKDKLSPRVREHMLLLAMLGALGEGDAQGMLAIEKHWSAQVPTSPALAPIRAFMMAWADGDAPSCGVSANATAAN